MSLTQPMIGYGKTITANTGPHVRITYSDATTDDVDFSSDAGGTFYAQGDGAASDLIDRLQDALNTNATAVGFVVTLHDPAHGRLVIDSDDDPKTVTSITFLVPTQLSQVDYGLALASGTEVVTFVDSKATSPYRVPSLWIPSGCEDHSGRRTYQDTAVVQTVGTGAGVVDVYEGPTEWEVVLYEVTAVLMRTQHNATTSYLSRLSGALAVASGDTHAALDGWLRRLHRLCGGAIPTLRWTPDIAAPGTYRSVRTTNAALYGSILGWQEAENLAPDYSDLRFGLTEVV